MLLRRPPPSPPPALPPARPLPRFRPAPPISLCRCCLVPVLTCHPLGPQLQDARGPVWLVQGYVCPVKLCFLIRYIRCALNHREDPPDWPSARLPARHWGSCTPPLSPLPTWAPPSLPGRALSPGVLLRGPAQPCVPAPAAVVTLRTHTGPKSCGCSFARGHKSKEKHSILKLSPRACR